MIDKFEKALGVLPLPDEFNEILKSVKDEYEREGVFFLEREYLSAAQKRASVCPRTMTEVLESAEEIKNDKLAAEYALFVCRAMENRELFMKHLKSIEFPEKYPYLAFLCLIPAAVKTWEFLTEKGLPEDVVNATVGQYEECLFVYRERFDHLGMNKRYFNHLQGYVDNKFLNIGRLRFEIMKNEELYVLENKITKEQTVFLHNARMNADGLLVETPPVNENGAFDAAFSETDDCYIGNSINKKGRCEREAVVLSKTDYLVKLRPDDDCLSVHIPSQGALTVEACKDSYERAISIFKKYYPELDVKALHCHSWMMSPELSGILKPESNLLAFQKPYMKFPVETEGKDVLNFVFKLKFKTYEDLAEDTSLQRTLKKMYLSGQYLYEYGGIMIV